MSIDLRGARRLVLALAGCLLALPAWSQDALSIKPLAEKRVDGLPEGALFWRIENFASASEAAAAATPWSLSVQAAGKVWLFTLGKPRWGRAERAARVTEVGPIPRVSATEYLLRINEATGVPGSVTPVHSHPGSEAFYVLQGQQEHPRRARRPAHRRRQGGSRPRSRPADAGLEQRQHGFARAGDVRRRRQAPVLVAGRTPLSRRRL